MLTAVSVSTEAGFTLGQPQELFELHGPQFDYDVSADGQRFLTVREVQSDDGDEPAPPSIRIVQNWYEEFRDRGE